MEQAFTAAVVQAAPVPFDTPAMLSKLAGLTRDAAGQGASLVVFPQAVVGGYPRGLTFGADLGSRSPERREEFRRYHASATDIPGPESARLDRIARDNGVHLVVGVIEREGGTRDCQALTYGPEAGLPYKHRKLMPAALVALAALWLFRSLQGSDPRATPVLLALFILFLGYSGLGISIWPISSRQTSPSARPPRC